MYSNSESICHLSLRLTLLSEATPSSQKVHRKGQPRLVCITGSNTPSKNSSNFPVVYGDGTAVKFRIRGAYSVRNTLAFSDIEWTECRLSFTLDVSKSELIKKAIRLANPISPSFGT